MSLDSGSLIPDAQLVCAGAHRADQAGVADWPLDDIVALLRDGTSHGAALGRWPTWSQPAASARRRPARHRGIPRALPQQARQRASSRKPPDPARQEAGARLLRQTLQRLPWRERRRARTAGGTIAPALAGNRLVNMEPPVNLIRVIVHGGFAGHARQSAIPSACRLSASRSPTGRSPRWPATCAAAGAMRPAR